MSVFGSINERFTSGNRVPVSRARITSEEWRQIKDERDQLRAENERLRHDIERYVQIAADEATAIAQETGQYDDTEAYE